MQAAPTGDVRAAFGIQGDLHPLERRGGRTWIGDDVVLKRDVSEREWTWVAENLADVSSDHFRLARALRAADGRWIVDGWCAQERVDGEHASDRYDDVIAVGELLHREIAHVPRPDYVDGETHPWAVADRVAFDEEDVELPRPIAELVERFRSNLSKGDLPSQVIHGDLANNVLFHETLSPAIIDFTPRFRPKPYASAIVVFDALAYEGASPDLVDVLDGVDGRRDMLSRAAIFRLVTAGIAFRDDKPLIDQHAAAARTVVELAGFV